MRSYKHNSPPRHLRQLRLFLNALVGLTGRKGGLPCCPLAPTDGLPCLCHCVCRLHGGRAAKRQGWRPARSDKERIWEPHTPHWREERGQSQRLPRQERPLSRRSKPAHSTRERVARLCPIAKATQRTRRCTMTEDIVHDDPATSARTLLAESLLRHEVVRSFHSDAHVRNVRTSWKFDPLPELLLGLYLHT